MGVCGGDDGAVRAWELEQAGPLGEPLAGHEGWVNAVAVASIGDRPVAVSGGDDGTVRAWDLSGGGPLGRPLRLDRGVNAVAVGELQGAPPPAWGETHRDTDEPAAWSVAADGRRDAETAPESGVADPGTSPESVTAGASTSSMPPRARATQVTGRTAGMRIRAHRRLDMVLLLIGALLVGGAAAIGAVAGDGERVTGLWAGAAIGSDGRAGVVEVIDYDFGTGQRHGIFRDVPGLSSSAQVAVSSATATGDMTLEDMEYATRIRIGDPARTITGRHRYKIGYAVDGVAPGGRLAWDAVGTQWPVRVGNVEIHVVAPFEFRGARCVQGEAGSQRPCDLAQPEPGHLVATIRTLPAGQGATLYAAGGRRLEHAPALPGPSACSRGRRDQRRPPGCAGGRGRRAGRIGADVVAGAAGQAVACGTGGLRHRAGLAMADRVDTAKLGCSPPPGSSAAGADASTQDVRAAEAVRRTQMVRAGAAADGHS
jgi:hypothetical protein